MMRPRDRLSAAGLLPRMEARPRKDGLTTYRYHPLGGRPINLGTDRAAAIQRVADMLGTRSDAGTIAQMWRLYQESPAWRDLRPRTQADYQVYSAQLLRVFGAVRAADVQAPDVARYLRVERADAPVRANREISLLGTLIGVAIERGEATHNPCRGGQVRRNRERPRTMAPPWAEVQALVEHAATRGKRMPVIVMAAELAALTGARQGELLAASWTQVDLEAGELRLARSKQRLGAERWDRVTISPALRALLDRLAAMAADSRIGALLPTRAGNPYTSSGYASMWQRLMVSAVDAGVVARRWTFHDLRSAYTSAHKLREGSLPELHASPTTTARVYDRTREGRRKAL